MWSIYNYDKEGKIIRKKVIELPKVCINIPKDNIPIIIYDEKKESNI